MQTIDREQVAMYNLTIAASSNNFVSSGTAQVTVTVLDSNDNAPIFTPSTFTFNVNESGPNFSIGTVSASDDDAGINAAIVYTISGDGGTFFNIDRSSGEITTSMTVNFETNPMITFTVTATDGGSPTMSSMAMVTVVVMDVNDNVPQFSQDPYDVTVDEYSENGTLVVVLNATDADSGVNGEVQYFISDVTPAGNFFSLDPVSGELDVSTEMLPSISQNSMYTLRIGARDMGVTPRTGMVTANIRVIDTNEPPEFPQATYNLMIQENDEDFTYTLNAMDPDTYTNYTVLVYNIPSVNGTASGSGSGSGDGSHIVVDEITGVLSINVPFDFEDESSVMIMVEASDPNVSTLFDTAIVSIQVIDVNDNAPIFNESFYMFTASENATINSVITDEIAAYDVDTVSRGMLQFSIESGIPDSTKFAINTTTGVITLVSPLNATAAETFTLTVSVSDGMMASQVMVTISITDVNNHAPVFTQQTYTTRVSELTSVNDQIVAVTAIDSDLEDFGTITYSIETVQDTFMISEDTGNITLNQSLDFEMTPNYTLTVRATDGGGMYGEANVIVNIMDENDNLPVFDMTMYNFDVLEGVQRLHIAGRVMADDADSGLFGEVVYSISDTDNGTLPFTINQGTGEIIVNSLLDYETDPYYLFEVEAMDRGAAANSTTVMVNVSVVDENDNIPMFNQSLYAIRVSEDVNISSTIFTAFASDRDSGENSRLTYTITGSNPAICDSIYDIEAASGEVTNVLQLDADNFNNGSQCLLVIEARDAGTPVRSVTASFQVNVDNVNEHAPMFIGESTASFAENAAPGTVVFTVTARDSDNFLNPNDVEYSINGTTNFEINERTGAITVAADAMIDRDVPEGDTETFIVTATDRATMPLLTNQLITFTFTDVNDSPARFSQSEYSVRIRESTQANTVIGSVSATDADELPAFNTIFYTLVENAENQIDYGKFSMGFMNGQLRLTNQIDFDTEQRVYILRVSAGDSTHQTFVNFRVEVLDTNDLRPQFTDLPTNVELPENATDGDFVYQVVATDNDISVNGRIIYELMDDGDGKFTIDNSTGRVFVSGNDQFDYDEGNRTYVLEVSATDSAGMMSSGSGDVDLNDTQLTEVSTLTA